MKNIAEMLNGRPVTTSLAIAEGTKYPHKSVIQLIRQYAGDLEDFGKLVFEKRTFETANDTQSREIAILNEQQTTLLITYMLDNDVVSEFKVRLIQALYEEKQARDVTLVDINDPEFMREVLLKAAARVEKLKGEILALEQKVAEDAPKVAFHDWVVTTRDTISVGLAAQLIGTGRGRLFSFMRKIGWVTLRNQPYRAKIEAGYLDVNQAATTQVTGKGLAELHKLYTAEIAAQ